MVSIGAVSGTWLRFKLVHYFQANFNKKHWGTFAVNLIASFLLGLTIPNFDKSVSSIQYLWLSLFFCIGFLGSLSTFSAYILDIFKLFIKQKFIESSVLFFLSIAGGLVVASFGYWIGNKI